MSQPATELRDQLAAVYARMQLRGAAGEEEVAFAEDAFAHLSYLQDLLPPGGATEAIFRLSNEQPTRKVAELYNVLIWSNGDGEGTGIDPQAIQDWFYSGQRRRIAVASQVDLFPSNSMDESERIVAELRRRFPDLEHLLQPLQAAVDHRLREERAWSEYRRETFEMPREVTPAILSIIDRIKRQR